MNPSEKGEGLVRAGIILCCTSCRTLATALIIITKIMCFQIENGLVGLVILTNHIDPQRVLHKFCLQIVQKLFF